VRQPETVIKLTKFKFPHRKIYP